VEVEAGSRRRETAQLAAATSVVKGRSESTRIVDLLLDFVDEPGGVEKIKPTASGRGIRYNLDVHQA
jgi:hypothetical protein